MTGSISIQVPSYGYIYTFSGVISIQHEFTLKILTEAESASGTDYVNGARNKPDKIILTVAETDVGKLTGWADRILCGRDGGSDEGCMSPDAPESCQ